ncbi:MAG: type II CAAX prenyl endopeptidase Rce1 family protein [Chloroflexota bacterium]
MTLGATALATQGPRVLEGLVPWFLVEGLGYLAILVPLLVAGGLAYLVHDRPFRRDFWRRLARFWHTGAGWTLVILLFFPAKAALAVLFDVAQGQAVDVLGFVRLLAYDPIYIVPALLEWLFIGSVFGEPGWRGYALDGLQARYNALVSSLIVGVARLLWLILLPFSLRPGELNDRFPGAPQFVLWAIAVVLGSVIYTWIYNNTGRSILAVMVFHFVGNAVGDLIDLSGRGWYVGFRWELNQILLIAAVVAVVAVWGARTLTRARWSAGFFARPTADRSRGALDG